MNALLPASLANLPQWETVESPCPHCQGSESDPVASGYDWRLHSSRNLYTVVQCLGCGLLRLTPRPHPRYDYEAGPAGFLLSHPGLLNFFDRRRIEDFRYYMGEGEKRVLIMGAGAGRQLLLLSQEGPSCWLLQGIDPWASPEEIADCRERYIALSPLPLDDFPVQNWPLDLILVHHLLERVNEPTALLTQCRQALSRQGRLVVDVVSWDAVERRLLGNEWWAGWDFPRHRTLFTATTFEAMALANGLKVIKTIPLPSPATWIGTFQRRFGGKVGRNSPPWLVAAGLLEAINLLTVGKTAQVRFVLERAAT